jgi:hypothetical protein
VTSGSSLRSLALVVGGVAVGVAVAVGASSVTGGGDDERTTFGRAATGDSSRLLDADRRAEVQGERLRADSPQAAVEAFLAAERSGDFDTSFAYLADTGRIEYGSASAWRADHPDALAPVTGFELDGEVTGGNGEARVPTVMSYRSSLDSVVGLVPARARTNWVAVEEDDGWAVDVVASSQEVLLPPDEDAVQAVQAWASEQQQCGEPEQYSGGLRGRDDLARQLCGATGDVAATDVGMLQQIDAQPLQNSFGAEVVSWARTVTVEGAVPLRAVVAPVEDRWLVVGLLAPPGGG